MEQQLLEDEPYDCQRLDLINVVGFNGVVPNGLKFHPDREHIIYALGCSVVIENIKSKKHPELLMGHTDCVSCIAVSNKDGQLIASGQRTHMGFLADIIIWDYPSRQRLYTLKPLHKVNIQALAFSANNKILASLGGKDDGSVVIWNMETGEAICGDQAQVKSAGDTLCISFSKKDDNIFVTGGDSTLRVWDLDVTNRKIRPAEVGMGQIKRRVECIVMDDDNPDHPNRRFFYCGTSTGDVLAINMKSNYFQYKAPLKGSFEMGVTALTHVKKDYFLVGTRCGKVYELQFPLPPEDQKSNKQPKPVILGCWEDTSVKSSSQSAVTSIALRGAGHQFYVGTTNGRMYSFLYEDKFKDCKLIKTCHSEPVNDILFPPQSSDLIVTCQKEQIRIWDMKNMKELKRHVVGSMTCNSLAMSDDGTFIISAWDDGKIRVISFDKNGDLKVKKVIENAHSKGVTSVVCTKNHCPMRGEWDYLFISGGGEGQVRIWNYRQRGDGEPSCTLLDTLKEHKGLVSDIKVTKNDDMCVSASTDGTSIMWDLQKRRRRETVFANTLFKCVVYNRDENQIITSGTDRKIAYWEVDNAGLIRQLDGAKTEAVNAIDISYDGEYFVSGGDDKLIKLWNYDSGEILAVGQGHSDKITKIRICPSMKYIVSVSHDGAILVWRFPFPPKC